MQNSLSSKIENWIKKEKVLDVVTFGSSVRGKHKPGDLDVCIVINDKDAQKSLDLVESLGNMLGEKAHVSVITASEFLNGNTLAKTLLSEGVSSRTGKHFAQIFGFVSTSLFVYSLKNFSASKRVRFHYLLQGRRGTSGILKQVRGSFLGKGVIAVPTEYEDALKPIFDTWGLDYKIKRALVG